MHRTLSVLICFSHTAHIGHFPSVATLTIAGPRRIEEWPIRRARAVRGTGPRSLRTRGSSAPPATARGEQSGAGPGRNSAEAAGRAGRTPALPRRPSAGVAGTAGQGATLGDRAPGSRGHSRVAVRFPSVLAAGAGWDRGVAQLVLCVPRCLSGGLSRLGTAGQVTQTRGQGPRGHSAGLASGTCFPA